jgi:hypothetical protein
MPRHDSLFKGLIPAFLADLLQLVVPDLAGKLELPRARSLDKEFFTGLGGRREVDLLLEVPVATANGRRLLVHVEIEARARRGMAERLRSYHCHLQALHGCEVLSLVLYLRRGRPGVRAETVPGAVLRTEHGGFGYLAFGLAGCRAADYLEKPEPLAWALAALMDPAPLDQVQLKLACLRRIASADLDDARRLRLVDCVEAYLPLNSGEQARYDAALAADGTNEEVCVMAMTWSQRLEAKGMKKGLQEGRREGKKEELQQTLLRLLKLRFRELPESTRRQVEAIESLARLRRLTERVLVAGSIEEMGIG